MKVEEGKGENVVAARGERWKHLSEHEGRLTGVASFRYRRAAPLHLGTKALLGEIWRESFPTMDIHPAECKSFQQVARLQWASLEDDPSAMR
jgi:hypothetical protein